MPDRDEKENIKKQENFPRKFGREISNFINNGAIIQACDKIDETSNQQVIFSL